MKIEKNFGTDTQRSNMAFEKVLVKDASHPYMILSNDPSCFTRDRRLSGNERLVLETMFSVDSSTWHFSVSGLRTMCSLGKTAIYNALKKLQQHGYLIIEKRRDAKGQFLASKYHFYEVAQPVEEEKISDTENNVPTLFYPCPDFQNPAIGEHGFTPQLTNNEKNKNLPSINSQSVSLVGETTDGLQTIPQEDFSSENKEQFIPLENMLRNQSDYDSMKQNLKDFIPNAIKYLEAAVISGSIELSEVIDKLEEIIRAEGSLFAFCKKISYVCKKALRKLRDPSKEDSFLTSTIRNQLQEYKPKTQEIQNHPELVPEKATQEYQGRPMPSRPKPAKKEHLSPLSFRDMLTQLGNPLLNDCFRYGDEIFENEEAFIEFYGDFGLDDWGVQRCSIPDSFKDRPEDMENALKFLIGWSSLPSDDLLDGEYKAFVGKTIHFLAKAIHNDESISAWNIISKLNHINMDIDDREESLYKFMESFYEHFKKQVVLYPIRSNEEKYITKMLINYLMHDYQAKDMIGIGKMMGYLESFKKK